MTNKQTIDGASRELLERVEDLLACPQHHVRAEYVTAYTELRALLDKPAGNMIDLDDLDWKSIKEAAAESKWMPPEYTRNDWVSDICAFLREGPAAQPQGEPGDSQAFEKFWYSEKTTAIGSTEAQKYFDAGAKHGRKGLPAQSQGEVERLREEIERRRIRGQNCSNKVSTMRAQLADRDALLNRWLDMFDGGISSSMLGVLRESTRSSLSTTKEG